MIMRTQRRFLCALLSSALGTLEFARIIQTPYTKTNETICRCLLIWRWLQTANNARWMGNAARATDRTTTNRRSHCRPLWTNWNCSLFFIITNAADAAARRAGDARYSSSARGVVTECRGRHQLLSRWCLADDIWKTTSWAACCRVVR